MKAVEFESVSIRFPVNLKRWIEKQAADNLRSQNSQVLTIIKERMEQEQREKAVR